MTDDQQKIHDLRVELDRYRELLEEYKTLIVELKRNQCQCPPQQPPVLWHKASSPEHINLPYGSGTGV